MPTFPELELHSITYSIWRYWFLPKKALVYHHFSIIYDILFTFIPLNSNFHSCWHTHATIIIIIIIIFSFLLRYYCRKLDSIQCKFLLFCDIFFFFLIVFCSIEILKIFFLVACMILFHTPTYVHEIIVYST